MPPQSTVAEHPPALPQGDPSALAQGNVLPPIHQNNNPPAVPVPSTLTSGTVSSGIELSYPLPHTLSSTIGHDISLISSVNQNPTPLISVLHCLGIHVAQPMKEKIWAKDYIDLSKLIQPDPDTDKTDQHKFSILDGQLVMSPKTNPKKITSLEAWTDAFIVFASIYLTRHPTDIQGILKYMQTIRLGRSRNPNASWLEYDKQFRLKMSADSTISWASVDAELWLIYMSNQPLTQQNQSNLKCYDHNFKGSCSRQHCLYLHSCMYCHKNHPRIHCWSLQSSQSVNTRHNPSQPIQSNNASFRSSLHNHTIRPREPFQTSSTRQPFQYPTQRFMGPRHISS